MLHGRYTHISQYIRNVAMELATAASRICRSTLSALHTKKLQLTGAVSTPPTLLGTDQTPMVLQTVVDPSSHRHSISTISGGVEPTPDTAVVRDSQGHIRSSGSSASETGFKLADGRDLGTLFVRTDQQIINFRNEDDGTSGNVITKLKLSCKGNTLILTRTRGYIQPSS